MTHDPPIEILEQYKKTDRLVYDKVNMRFNFTDGNGLICDKSGCWLVEKIKFR